MRISARFSPRASVLRTIQNTAPAPMKVTICASQTARKNFQNRRPTGLFLHQLIAHAIDRLDARTSVGEGAEFLPDAAHVDIDAAIEARERTSQPAFGQFLLADGAPGIACEHFEQIEFGAGQADRLAMPFHAAPRGPQD